MSVLLKYLIFCVVGIHCCQAFGIFSFLASLNPFRKQPGCDDIKIVSRQSWGWLRQARGIDLKTPVGFVIVHQTGGSSCKTKRECEDIVNALHNNHEKKTLVQNMDIGFNFIIAGDGRVYEGRGWEKAGEHAFGWSKKSLGIVFIGNYSTVPPPEMMQKVGKNLILCGITKEKIQNYYGLYDYGDTTCPPCQESAFYQALTKWDNWHFRDGPAANCM